MRTLILVWACASGACADLNPFQAPYLLVAREGSTVVADGTHVYWGAYDGIHYAKLTNESEARTLVTLSKDVRELAADDTDLYWLMKVFTPETGMDSLVLQHVGKNGAEKTPFDLDTTGLGPCENVSNGAESFEPQSLALDRDYVYFLARPQSASEEPCQGYRVKKTGDELAESITPLSIANSEGNNPRAWAVDDTTLYWVVTTTDQLKVTSLYAKAKDSPSSAFDLVCAVDSGTGRVVVDDTDVWLATTGGVMRVPKATHEPAKLAGTKQGSATSVLAMAVDDTDVYWVVAGWSPSNGGDAALYQTKKDGNGGATRLVKFDLDAPANTVPEYNWAISVTDGWVYSALRLSEAFGGPDGVFKIHE